MAALDTSNLINFSGDEIQQNAQVPENNESTFPYLDTQISNEASRYSFDNNPFDRALKQVALMDDPFESVFQEAEGYSKTPELEVETDQLLSISIEERTLSGENKSTQDLLAFPTFSRTMSIRSTESAGISSISSINSLQCSSSNLDSVFDVTANLADKPLKFNTAFVDGVNENDTNLESSEVDTSCGILNKGFVNHTDSGRMQKSLNDSGKGNSSPKELSIQNSSPSTSVMRHRVKKEQYNLLKLSLANNSSPALSGSDGSESFGESLRKEASSIAVELSKVDQNKSTRDESCCEDLMSIKPPNWADSEGDLESDLELLKIPMLEQIQNKENRPQIAVEPAAEVEGATSQNTARVKIRRSLDLAALKERIQQEKLKTLSSDVEGIIANLRKIVLDCSNEEKKAEANNLLETLSSVLTDKTQEEPATLIPPQPIIRQGTFDIDKPIPKEANHNSPTQVNQQSAQLEEDETCSSPNIHMTVPDIVEQIGKLFGNDNFNVVQTNLSGSSTGSNPTYIVVMGTPAMPSRNSAHIHNIEGDGSPELMSSHIRRRSYSLSLVDKGGFLKCDAAGKKTPLPIGSGRRNSFSSSLKAPGLHNVRRSIYGPISKNTDPAYTNQKMLKPTPEIKVPGVPFKHVNPEIIQKKLRTTSNESISKNRGPLKATVPLKRMAPMIVTPSVSSPIDEKQKFKPITSTPIVLTSKAKGFPNACSTPTLQVSPVKGAGKNRPRYSYLSITPNPKGRISTHQRRRSLTEIKSPRKGLETVKEIGAEKSQVKSNRLSRLAPVKAGRSQRRESIVDNKENKENKLSRAAT